MKYNCLDFAILCAINEKNYLEEEIIYKSSLGFPAPPSFELFDSSFVSLLCGGYITFIDGKVTFTDKSRATFKKKSIFESQSAMLSRLEDNLLATDRADNPGITTILSYDAYKRATSRLSEEYSFDSILKFEVRNGEGYILLTPPKNESDDCSDGEISKCDTLSLPLSRNESVGTGIFESATSLASPSKAKKVCISDGASHYVMTMAQDSGKIKISVQKILFNAKRFMGKRDSQLDYAQCSDTCISFYTTQNILYMSAALILLECECRQG